MSDKTVLWNGQNKQYVRECKLNYIKQYAPKLPSILSFPGAKALFEKMIIDSNTSPAEKICGIQTKNKMSEYNDGPKILGLLKNTLSERGWNITLYEENLSDVVNRDSLGPFDVLDLDVCCSISESFLLSVDKLFDKRVPSNKGVLFINHMKGREQRPDIDFLMGLSEIAPFIQKPSLTSNTCWSMMVDNVSKLSTYQYPPPTRRRALVKDAYPLPHMKRWDTYLFRYYWIPVLYSWIALENGYCLTLDRVIEYRDLSEDNPYAVNMIQYFFRYSRSSSSSAAHKAVLTRSLLQSLRVANRAKEEALSCSNQTIFDGIVYTKRLT